MRRRGLWCGVATGLLVACSGTNASPGPGTGQATDTTLTTTTQAAPTTTLPPSSQADLDVAFQQLGIDPSAAPAAAVQLDNAEFCGWEDDGPSGNDQPNTDGRRCFVEAQFDGRSALYVWQVRTNEGDPLAVVYRTKGGAVSMYIDHTRDSLGTSGWEGGPCIGLTIETNGAFNPPLLQFHCTVPDPTTT